MDIRNITRTVHLIFNEVMSSVKRYQDMTSQSERGTQNDCFVFHSPPTDDMRFPVTKSRTKHFYTNKTKEWLIFTLFNDTFSTVDVIQHLLSTPFESALHFNSVFPGLWYGYAVIIPSVPVCTRTVFNTRCGRDWERVFAAAGQGIGRTLIYLHYFRSKYKLLFCHIVLSLPSAVIHHPSNRSNFYSVRIDWPRRDMFENLTVWSNVHLIDEPPEL
jgi:hypothetical protein